MGDPTVATYQLSKRVWRAWTGVVGLVVAAGYTVESFRIPAGQAATPGAGLFPRVVGFAAMAISVLVVLEALCSKDAQGTVEMPRGGRARLVVAFFAATTLFVVVLPFVGQYIASALYLVATVRLLSTISWFKVIVYSVVLSVATSWVFIALLGVQLPAGFW